MWILGGVGEERVRLEYVVVLGCWDNGGCRKVGGVG